MKSRRLKIALIAISSVALLGVGGFVLDSSLGLGMISDSGQSPHPKYKIGEQIDSLNGVAVYYNGTIAHVEGRNLAPDGYNIGQKYQCVEFVKRYYYEHLKHKMPDSYGHAYDFFDPELKDGAKNTRRDLTQYRNPSSTQPRPDDLLVYSGYYGHVAIVASASEHEIEIIQQNPGPFNASREKIAITAVVEEGVTKWKLDNDRILGWLRKE